MSPLLQRNESETWNADLDAVLADLEALAHGEAPLLAAPSSPRLVRLRHLFRLDDVALRFAVWAVAITTDPLAVLTAEAAGDSDARRGLSVPEFARWLALDTRTARRLSSALGADGGLVGLGLLEPDSPRTLASGGRYRAGACLTAWLGGEDAVPRPLRALSSVDPTLIECFPPTESMALDAALATTRARLLVVDGPLAADVEARVEHALHAGCRRGLLLDLDAIAGDAEAHAAARRLAAECVLRGHVPVLRAGSERSTLQGLLDASLAPVPGPIVCLDIDAAGLFPGASLARVRLSPALADARRELWRLAIGDDKDPLTEADIDLLATRYEVGASRVANVIADVRACSEALPLACGRIEEALRGSCQDLGDVCATWRRPTRTWDDLVLPDDVLSEVRLLVARVRHTHLVLDRWQLGRRLGVGGGVVGLLSGPPGTGKTLIAEVVASELGVDVLQLDLAQATSRWLGETEKNLARVFDAAEGGGAMLLLDEADSLLARRTAVNSTNDRYANLGVNYLLQRLDSFRGLALLTTNLESSLDPALRRRLAAHIIVPAPAKDELARMWCRALAGDLPVTGAADVGALAQRFAKLTGATVKNAVLRAAYSAAAEGRVVAHADLERAARAEYVQLGHSL